MRKNSICGIKNHRSAAVRGGARHVRPPPGAASVQLRTYLCSKGINNNHSFADCVNKWIIAFLKNATSIIYKNI